MPLPPHRLLLRKDPGWFNLSDAGLLTQVSWKRGCSTDAYYGRPM